MKFPATRHELGAELGQQFGDAGQGAPLRRPVAKERMS
jgi:hypothetical protein